MDFLVLQSNASFISSQSDRCKEIPLADMQVSRKAYINTYLGILLYVV